MDSNMFDDEMIPMHEAIPGDNLSRQNYNEMMMPNMNMQGMPMYTKQSYGNMQYMPMYTTPMYNMPAQNVGTQVTPNYVMPMYNMPNTYSAQNMYTPPGMYNMPDMGHFYHMCPMMHNMPMHTHNDMYHLNSSTNPYMKSEFDIDFDMDYLKLMRGSQEEPDTNINLNQDMNSREQPQEEDMHNDIEEDDIIEDSRIYGSIEEIVARIEQYNPGIFKTMASFGIPYAESRRIIRRIVRLTSAYSG